LLARDKPSCRRKSKREPKGEMEVDGDSQGTTIIPFRIVRGHKRSLRPREKIAGNEGSAAKLHQGPTRDEF